MIADTCLVLYACSVHGSRFLHGVPARVRSADLRPPTVQSQTTTTARVRLSAVRRKVSVPHVGELSSPYR